MEHVIIHISDLHVTLYKKSNGSKNEKIASYLTTNEVEEGSNHYIDEFIEVIKKDFPGDKYILLVTGDISNFGEINEFRYSEKFINRIITGLRISTENCLILPGDHDVHRRSLANELEKQPTDSAHLLNSIKFKNFSDFYLNVKKVAFPFDRIIIDHIQIADRVILLGINSNYMINDEGGEGFIPIEDFKKEVQDLKTQLGNDQLNYVACWHHNFTAGFEDTNSGQWNPENRRFLLAELESENIKLVLTGNEHTSNSKSLLVGTIMTSDCGAFSSLKFDTTFKVYPIKINGDIIFENKIYALQKTNGNDTAFFWDKRDNHAAKQEKNFPIFVENKQQIGDVIELPQPVVGEDEIHEEYVKVPLVFYNNVEIAEKLYHLIRDKKLFHSGHFHWSDTSRAHNWIDISKLLEDNKDLYFVQGAVIDVIETFELDTNCDLIIGLGYEGNIISSRASIKYNIPYTSLPYSYRYNEHHEYEKKLNFDNSGGKFKKVIIITDVVNDGRTIRKLVHKREFEFFKNVEEIVVVSLLYTGHEVLNTDILNYNKLPENFDLENDHEVNNITYYTVKSLRVEKCPFGKEYKEACLIYKDELSCVHLFYDEKIKPE